MGTGMVATPRPGQEVSSEYGTRMYLCLPLLPVCAMNPPSIFVSKTSLTRSSARLLESQMLFRLDDEVPTSLRKSRRSLMRLIRPSYLGTRTPRTVS